MDKMLLIAMAAIKLKLRACRRIPIDTGKQQNDIL
jgi:hypothetical protein